MDIYEIINFINYDIIQNNKLIQQSTNNNEKYSYILYDTYDIYIKNICQIKNINFEYIIIIDLDVLINDIEKSYSNLEELQKQFILDIQRSSMTYNGHNIKDIPQLLDYLEDKYRLTNYKLEKEILMLSTQSIFAIPFYIIQSQFIAEHLYLAEITDLDMKKYNIKKKYKIDILKSNIKLEKFLRLFSLSESNDSITKYIVRILIDINLIGDRYFILNYYFFN